MEGMDIQEEFKQILEYAIQRGNENEQITVKEFVNELAIHLKPLVEKSNTKGLSVTR
ncbi:hypothetical protein [Lysinibacillus sp. SGAir0095]|uniref:hypothetical protein n=1 Tax=Lysinibacillus sp. SGAir0095 TaxID=2070463 RepID=UPI00143D5CC6|nr:hypothetical protein [Lysinibacillus sp. SGAir0095]